MITVDEHLRRILAAARPLPAHSVELAAALGSVLAEDVRGRWPVPLFDNSAMDGYAVRGGDATPGARLRVVADVPAGSGEDPRFGPGEAVRIMTGAPVPTDADAIVPLEATDLGIAVSAVAPESIVVTRAPKPGAHIRRRGEDAAADAVTVAAGTELGPWQLSAVASAGHDRVRVRRRPRVAVVSTGSELVAPSADPARGEIPDSNSFLLAAALREAGAEPATVRTVADDEAALSAALAEIEADAVVLSGGASVGAFDVVRTVLGRSGVRFDSVAVQPGKPQGFGVSDDGMLVFCLPGNPVAVAVSFEMFVRPAVRSLAGHREVMRPRMIRRAAVGWRSPAQRDQVLPVIVDDESVRPAARGGSGSHLVASLADANGLALVPTGVDEVGVGDPVTVLVLR
ncbi:molybdopterin molybdenumtransferase MoeA [Tsukamurella sp. TY48]|nr:gephyrin-like molybdotransferase Glp [Tsukamurella sp. TY48]GIZ98600.1 molybdopterin molybdenumtransferase MoeA [Tsukamurella sp. TY48]